MCVSVFLPYDKVQLLNELIHYPGSTVKSLNFRTPENFSEIYVKFKQKVQTLGYFFQKEANGIANSEDSDQTAPLGAV